MICYGNNCNAGSIHRNTQTVCGAGAPAPSMPPLPLAPPTTCRDGRKRYRGRAVICVETGQRFESLAEAAESCGIGYANVARAVSPDCPYRKTAGGYHWTYTGKES